MLCACGVSPKAGIPRNLNRVEIRCKGHVMCMMCISKGRDPKEPKQSGDKV